MDPMLLRLWDSRHNRRGRRLEAHLESMMRGPAASFDLGGGQAAYRALRRMAGLGYVERLDGRGPRCRYRITLRGKCRVACGALGLRFLSLCVLAEARAMHAMQDERGIPREYPVCLLEAALEGVYAAKTVRNAASALCSAGMARPVRRGALRLSPARFGRFEPVLCELHEWTAGVRDRISMSAMGDPRAVAALRGRP